MISSGIDTQLAARQADTKDLVRFKQEMDGLKKRLSGGEQDTSAKLRDACEKFEAVFISKLWKEMRNTVKKEGYLHSKQEDQYMSMFDRDFAEKMAQSGGIGLADMIYDQLSEKLKQTSRDALAGGVRIKPLNAEPIAMPMGGGPIAMPERKPGMTLEDWGASEDSAGEVENVVADVSTTEAVNRPVPHQASDMEVKAQLDALARKLEAEHIKEGLLGHGRTNFGYGSDGVDGNRAQLGRKIAKNG